MTFPFTSTELYKDFKYNKPLPSGYCLSSPALSLNCKNMCFVFKRLDFYHTINYNTNLRWRISRPTLFLHELYQKKYTSQTEKKNHNSAFTVTNFSSLWSERIFNYSTTYDLKQFESRTKPSGFQLNIKLMWLVFPVIKFITNKSLRRTMVFYLKGDLWSTGKHQKNFLYRVTYEISQRKREA